jgi:hypothetical protein
MATLPFQEKAPLRQRLKQELILTRLKMKGLTFLEQGDFFKEHTFFVKRQGFALKCVQEIQDFLQQKKMLEGQVSEPLLTYILDGYSPKGRYLRNNAPTLEQVQQHLQKGYTTILQNLHTLKELSSLTEDLLGSLFAPRNATGS